MNQGMSITLTRKSGEYSIARGSKGLFAVRYSKIMGRSRLKVFHSGNYLFLRYGIKEDGKVRDEWYEEVFKEIRESLKNPPDHSNLELFDGECLAVYANGDDFSDPSDVAVIGMIPIRQYQRVEIDVWGRDYKVVCAKDLNEEDARDIRLRKLVQERLTNSGLEGVLKF